MIEIKITAVDANEAHSEMRKLLNGVHIGSEPTMRTASEAIALGKEQFKDAKNPGEHMVKAFVEHAEKVLADDTEHDEDQMDFEAEAVLADIKAEAAEVPQATDVPEKPKRSPKAKKVKAEPVTVIDNTKDTHTEKMVEATAVKTDIPAEPKNFYSANDFKLAFVKIMSDLVKNGTLTQEYVAEKAKYYGVVYIFTIVDDPAKVTHFYETLVKEGHITRKADY